MQDKLEPRWEQLCIVSLSLCFCQECQSFIYHSVSRRGVCFISSYHCFHFAPMVCMEMWKHDWVTPWPKCHAGEENWRIVNISHLFFLSNKATSCTTLDPSCNTNTVHVCETQSKLLTVTKYLLLSPEMTRVPCLFLFPCVHVPDIAAPSSPRDTHTHTQRWVVLLCLLATCLATVPLLWWTGAVYNFRVWHLELASFVFVFEFI